MNRVRFSAAIALIVLVTALGIRRVSESGTARGLCNDPKSALVWAFTPLPLWALGSGATARVLGNAGPPMFNCFRQVEYVRAAREKLGDNVSSLVLDMAQNAPFPGTYAACERAGLLTPRQGLYAAMWWEHPAISCE
jgi:hypothetical protein